MITLKDNYRRIIGTFAAFLIGLITICVVHEQVHALVARQYCSHVEIFYIPSTEYFMSTVYGGCENIVQLKQEQRIVEIVGYQLIAAYTALVTFIVVYFEKIKGGSR